jgi:diguanylate cyclase (GGDEF)-like protein
MDDLKPSTTQPELSDLEKRQRRDVFLRHYANAQAYFSAQNYKESFKEIRKAGEIEPLNVKLARLAIEIFKRTQNSDGLITICQKMLDIDPDDTDMQLDLALGFFLSENYPVVIDMTTHLLNLDLNETEQLTCMELLADSLRKKNDFEKAKSLYLKILEKVDNPQRILIKLTACYYRLEDHKNVVVTSGRLIEMGYNDQNIVNLYHAAVEKTEKNIGRLYKPKGFLQALFRGAYDPVYAHLMSLEIEKEKMERRVDTEQRKAYTDALTGANNRAFFDERLIQYFTPGTLPVGTGFVFLFFDIDNFKTINDEYGHKMGDAVLVEYTKIGKIFFKQGLPGADRQIETWCRYGGEEFVALFFGTKTDAFKKADEFRLYVQGTLHIKVQQNQGKPVRIITCSGGLVEFPTEVKDFSEANQLADKRLYYAKNNGRNQIIKDGDGWTAALPAGKTV